MGEQLGERAQFPKVAVAADSLVLQRVSRLERVTGIEPALSAWESDMDPPSVLTTRI